jgi:type II secretory pathway component PulM
MWSGDDPRVLRMLITAGSVLAVAITSLSLWWALRPVAPGRIVLAQAAAPAVTGTTVATVTPALWTKTLWQPLVEPPAPAVQQLPQRLRLLAIITDDDRRTYALIDPQDDWGPMRLGVGESDRGVTVTAIHERAISVTERGKALRLELDL